VDRSVKVDFFNFTTRRSPLEVCALFAKLPNPLQPQDKGLHGYLFSFSSPDGVTILFTPGRPDVHVQISGRGCDALGLADLDILDLALESDHVTRLDIAIDCLNSGFTCGEIWGVLQRGEFVSVSSDIRQCEGLLSRGSVYERINRASAAPRPITRSNSGHTIYVGSKSSQRMVRIYDKGAESCTGTDWLRFEVQLRHESANQFYLLMKGPRPLSELAFGLLNKQIRLLAEGETVSNHDYSSLELHPFWKKLTDLVSPLKMMLPKPLKTVRNAIRYVRNAGSTLKMLSGVMPDFPEFLESLIHDASLKDHHRAFQDDIGLGRDVQADAYHQFLYSCTQFQSCAA